MYYAFQDCVTTNCPKGYRRELVKQLSLKGYGLFTFYLETNFLCYTERLHTQGFAKTCLFKCHSHSSDGMVVGTSLQRREHSEVDPALKVVHDVLPSLLVLTLDPTAEKDQPSSETW